MNYYDALNELYTQKDCGDAYERQWGYENPIAADYWKMRDELVLGAIARHFPEPRSDITALEVGTGHGHELAKLRSLGLIDRRLTGIDLLESRLVWARRAYPTIDFRVQDGAALSFPDSSFDLVMQFTCVMHAPTKHTQKAICREMARVLKPGGLLIWWDIAPPRWFTLLFKRALKILTNKNPLRLSLRELRNFARQMVTLCAPFRSSKPARSLHTNAISFEELRDHVNAITPDELREEFGFLTTRATYAGLDFELWKEILPRRRSLAMALWRKGWFSHHCFGIIVKDCSVRDCAT